MSVKNNLFPHLLPLDIEIWEAFLAERGDLYFRFEYDVRVGHGRDPGPSVGRDIQQMAIGLSQRRIDAVGFQMNQITIIEITARADLKCLGQVTAYPVLYQEKFQPTDIIRTLIVAGELGCDLGSTLDQMPVDLWIRP